MRRGGISADERQSRRGWQSQCARVISQLFLKDRIGEKCHADRNDLSWAETFRSIVCHCLRRTDGVLIATPHCSPLIVVEWGSKQCRLTVGMALFFAASSGTRSERKCRPSQRLHRSTRDSRIVCSCASPDENEGRRDTVCPRVTTEVIPCNPKSMLCSVTSPRETARHACGWPLSFVEAARRGPGNHQFP